MNVGIVYRGWESDLVSTPGYTGRASASTRIGSVSEIPPAQHQPDDKVHSDKLIQPKGHLQPRTDHFDLGAWHFDQPNFNDFSQQLLSVYKIQESKKSRDSTVYTTTMGSQGSEAIEATDAGIGVRFNRAENFTRDNLVMGSESSYEGSGFGSRGSSGSPSGPIIHRGRIAFLGPQYGFNTMAHIDLGLTHNDVVAPNSGDYRIIAANNMDTEDLKLDRDMPPVRFTMDREIAILGMRFHEAGQRLMIQQKLHAGLENARTEPGEPDLENNSRQVIELFLKSLVEKVLTADIDVNKPGSGSLITVNLPNGGQQDYLVTPLDPQPLEQVVGRQHDFSSVTTTAGPTYLGAAPQELNINLDTRLQLIDDLRVSGGGLPKVPDRRTTHADVKPPGVEVKIKIDLAGLGLRLTAAHFDREVVYPDLYITGFERTFIAAKKSAFNAEKALAEINIGAGSGGAAGRAGTSVSAQGSSSYTVISNPVLVGMDPISEYTNEYPPIEISRHERITITPIPITESNPSAPYIQSIKHQPFRDKLDPDRLYYSPGFPPEMIVLRISSSQPYDYRSHYQIVPVAERVRHTPREYLRLERHIFQNHNVEKDVENQRIQKITENQVYGRDDPRIQEVIRLKEIKELDRFSLETKYYEGQHTPPVDRGRRDMLPININALTVEALVWGWNHTG